MGPVYATRLTVYATNGNDGKDLGNRVVTACKDWLDDNRSQFNIPEPGYNQHVSSVDSAGRVSSLAITHLDHEGDRAWRASLQHPLVINNSVKQHSDRHTTIDIWEDPDAVVVTVRTSVVRKRDMVHPLDYTFRVPGCVPKLVEAFDEVSAGGLRCTTSAAMRDGAHVARQVLRSTRYIPIVVVGALSDADPQPLGDAIASSLVGMARTYVVPAGEIEEFNVPLPDHHRIQPGMVRLYWPEYSITDNADRHQVVPADLMGDPEDIALYLVRVIAPAAVVGFGFDQQVERLQMLCDQYQREQRESELKEKQRVLKEKNRALQRAQRSMSSSMQARKRVEAERDEAVARQQTALAEADEQWQATIAELEKRVTEAVEAETFAREVVESYSDQVNELKIQGNQLQFELEQKEQEVYIAQSKLDAQGAIPAVLPSTGPAPITKLTELVACKNNYDAVRLCAELLDDTYVLMTDTTWKSLKTSSFAMGPMRMVEYLVLLHRMAEYYFQNPGTAYEQAFNAAGGADASFSSRISNMMSASDREWYGVRWTRRDGSVGNGTAGLHLSYGSGSKARGFRLYFLVDETDRRFVVGKFGNHGPGVNKL